MNFNGFLSLEKIINSGYEKMNFVAKYERFLVAKKKKIIF